MQTAKPKIELYKIRSFSDKFNDTFSFVTQNWRQLLRYLCIFVLPISMLGAWCMDVYTSSIFGAGMGYGNPDLGFLSFVLAYASYALFAIIASMVTASIAYGFMRIYGEKGAIAERLPYKEFSPVFSKMFRRACIMVLVWLGILVVLFGVCFLFALITPVLIVVPILALIAVGVPLALISPAYMLTDDSIWKSMGKAWRYGWATWGGVFGVLVVMTLFVYIGAGALSLPYIVCVAVKSLLLSTSDASALSGAGGAVFTVLAYISSVLANFASSVFSVLLFVILGYQFGHSAEKIDGVTVQKDVEQFDHIDSPDDAPAVESDDISNFDQL